MSQEKIKLHVVEALRWGDRENHSYVVGVYTKLSDAKLAADMEKIWRAGKYETEINSVELDRLDPEKLDYYNECMW